MFHMHRLWEQCRSAVLPQPADGSRAVAPCSFKAVLIQRLDAASAALIMLAEEIPNGSPGHMARSIPRFQPG